MLKTLFRFIMILPLFAAAQQTTEYPADYLSPEFHAGRRAAFREMMPKNAVAFFFASQVRNRNNDVDYQFAQNKNFYYLAGLEEPNSLLIIYKEPVTILGKQEQSFYSFSQETLKEKCGQEKFWALMVLSLATKWRMFLRMISLPLQQLISAI